MAGETWPTYIKTTTNQLPTVSHQASFSFSGFMMMSITAAKKKEKFQKLHFLFPFLKKMLSDRQHSGLYWQMRIIVK